MTAPKLDRSNIVDFIADIFERRGAESYLGEQVSMSVRQHDIEILSTPQTSENVLAATTLAAALWLLPPRPPKKWCKPTASGAGMIS